MVRKTSLLFEERGEMPAGNNAASSKLSVCKNVGGLVPRGTLLYNRFLRRTKPLCKGI